MAGSGDDVELLLSRQVDELDRVAGNTDSEVCVLGLFRMLHSVLKLFKTEHIDVEVMSALIKVTVKDIDQIVLSRPRRDRARREP